MNSFFAVNIFYETKAKNRQQSKKGKKQLYQKPNFFGVLQKLVAMVAESGCAGNKWNTIGLGGQNYWSAWPYDACRQLPVNDPSWGE